MRNQRFSQLFAKKIFRGYHINQEKSKLQKSLQFTAEEHENLSVASAQNIDDLIIVPNERSDLKVFFAYTNGYNLDSDTKTIIRNLALSQWKNEKKNNLKNVSVIPCLHSDLNMDSSP